MMGSPWSLDHALEEESKVLACFLVHDMNDFASPHIPTILVGFVVVVDLIQTKTYLGSGNLN